MRETTTCMLCTLVLVRDTEPAQNVFCPAADRLSLPTRPYFFMPAKPSLRWPCNAGGGSLASPHLHSSWKKDGLAQCDSDREVGRLMELISIMRSGPRLWRERTSKLGHAVVTKRHKRSRSWPHMESCHDSEAHCTLSHVRCNLALVRRLGSRDIVTDLP
jgi:hypothetical protein